MIIEPIPHSSPFPEVVDNTMRSSYVECPTEFYWSYIRNRASTVTSIHLHFGACFAKGCETFRKMFYTGVPFPDALTIAQAAAVEAWGDYEPDIDPGTKTLERCLDALEWYFNHYHPKSDYVQPFIKENGEPAVELSFAIPIPEVLHPTSGNPILYAGRYDMLGLYNSQLFVIDEKTSKQLGASWRNQWDLRAQFTGYCWAAKQFGYPVVGAIVRGIGLLKTKTTTEEIITNRPDWMVDQWYEQLVEDLTNMVRDWERGKWSQNLASTCSAYSGCGKKVLCDKRDPEMWVDQYFVGRIWHPETGTTEEME